MGCRLSYEPAEQETDDHARSGEASGKPHKTGVVMLIPVALFLLLAFCWEVGIAVGGDGDHGAATLVRAFGKRPAFDELALQIVVRA